MIANTIELEGTLQADGRLILDEKPALKPGRVRVALRPLMESQIRERLPDSPWLDDTIPAPFDLPYVGDIVRIQPRWHRDRLPELTSALEHADDL
jgi:hypothetical protein